MIFDRSDFLTMLEKLKHTCAGRSQVTGLNHVFFDGVFAFTYDGVHLSRMRCHSDIRTSAPLASLVALAQNGGKTIEVKVEDEGNLWKSGRSRVRAESIPESAWQIRMDMFSSENFEDDSSTAATAIRAVLPRVYEVAATEDASQYPGVLVKFSGKRCYACATDNIRAGISFVSGSFTKREGFVVPASFAKVVQSTPGEVQSFFRNENWVGFEFNDAYEIFSRLIQYEESENPGYGFEIFRNLEWPAYRIKVDDKFIAAAKSIAAMGDDAVMTIAVEDGGIFLDGSTKKPPSEMRLTVGQTPSLLDGEGNPIKSDDEQFVMMENDRVRFHVKHALKLFHPDATLAFASEPVPVLAIDAHGAFYIVSLISILSG